MFYEAPTSTQRRVRLRLRPLLPERLRATRRPRWWEEILFIGISYLLYSLVRNGVPTHQVAAFERAVSVLHLERTLHINFELVVNEFVASVGWLAQVTNYYYATLHFVVTVSVLLWLYLRHPLRYRAVRSVIYATTLLALIGFWTYALAPPRMLPGYGYIDTIVTFHTWGSWGSTDVAAASNQFAAMPSLHIAWALWSAIAIVKLARRTWVRVLGAVYPLLTLFVIVGTANHFALDALGGVLVLAAGFGVQRMLSGQPTFRAPVLTS